MFLPSFFIIFTEKEESVTFYFIERLSEKKNVFGISFLNGEHNKHCVSCKDLDFPAFL